MSYQPARTPSTVTQPARIWEDAGPWASEDVFSARHAAARLNRLRRTSVCGALWLLVRRKRAVRLYRQHTPRFVPPVHVRCQPPLPPRTPRWQVPCLDPRPPACPALPTCSVSLHSYVRPPRSGPSCYRPGPMANSQAAASVDFHPPALPGKMLFLTHHRRAIPVLRFSAGERPSPTWTLHGAPP